MEAAIAAGLEVGRLRAASVFFFNAHNNLLEEVAKFRAARRFWARLMRDRFGAKSDRVLGSGSTPRPAARPLLRNSPR